MFDDIDARIGNIGKNPSRFNATLGDVEEIVKLGDASPEWQYGVLYYDLITDDLIPKWNSQYNDSTGVIYLNLYHHKPGRIYMPIEELKSNSGSLKKFFEYLDTVRIQTMIAGDA